MASIVTSIEMAPNNPAKKNNSIEGNKANCMSSKYSDVKPKSDVNRHRKQLSMPSDPSPIQTSFAMPCNLIPHCGPLSSSCGSVFYKDKAPEGFTPFSLPIGVKDTFSNEGKEDSCVSMGRNMLQEKDHLLNYSEASEDPSNVRIPVCDQLEQCTGYINNSGVVKNQPSRINMLTTSSEFISPKSGICSCINPGTSHACASRVSYRASLGIINPLFDQVTYAPQLSPGQPSSPRRFSLDSVLTPTSSGLPDFPNSFVLPSCQTSVLESDMDNLRLSDNPTMMTNIPNIGGPCFSNRGTVSSSEVGISSHEAQSNSTLNQDMKGSTSGISAVPNTSQSHPSQVKTPGALASDWFSLLTPSPEAYAQRLFSPEDLRDELLYPTPYGVTSEVYQNINAREADFVLLKPKRKPRVEAITPVSVPGEQSTVSKSSESKDQQKNNCSDTEEPSHQGNDNTTRKNSLIERRKSSLEKLYIPPIKEQIKPPLDIKVDNFDREEYINFKKRLSASDALTNELLKNSSNSCPLKPFSLPLRTCSDDVLNLSNIKRHLKQTETIQKNKKKPDKICKTKISEKNSINTKYNAVPTNLKNEKQLKNTSSRKKPQEKSYFLDNEFSHKSQILNYDAYMKSHLPRRNIRKQSLPTEELFSNRHPKINRYPSLNPLLDYQALERIQHKSGTFSPVRELDEEFSGLGDKSPNRNHLLKRHSIALIREEKCTREYRDFSYEGSEKSKQSNRRQKHKMHPVTEEKRKIKGLSRHKREKKTSSHSKSRVKDSSNKSHLHHQLSQEFLRAYPDIILKSEKESKGSRQRCNQDDPISDKKLRNLPQSSSSKRPFRKHQRHTTKPTHKASKVFTSPLGPGYEVNFPDLVVPYERLEECPSPTSLKNHPPLPESNRKENVQHRKPRRRQRHRNDDDCYLSSSLSSKSSSSSGSRSSRSSSSSSSSGSSSDLSSSSCTSSSSSDSSDSESTSSSSSSSSSSSDSSDIQDLIL